MDNKKMDADLNKVTERALGLNRDWEGMYKALVSETEELRVDGQSLRSILSATSAGREREADVAAKERKTYLTTIELLSTTLKVLTETMHAALRAEYAYSRRRE